MDPDTIVTISSLLLVILTLLFGGNYTVSRIKATAKAVSEAISEEHKGLTRSIIESRQAQARAAGTIRTAQARKAMPAPDDDQDDEDDLAPIMKALDHPLVAGFLEARGMDVDALKKGDMSQLQKAGQQDPQLTYM